jgi:PAS domain S-box-containing protein
MSDVRIDPPAELGRTLLDRVPSLLAYFDAELRCHFANTGYAAQSGLSSAEAVGRRMPELIGADVFERRRPHVARALAGEPQSFEDTLEQGGRRRSLLISYVPDIVGGRVQGFVVEITDISAQRLAERALRDSEARFRTLSESSPLGVYFADTAGRRTYMNARWREIYGLPGELGLGDGWMRALHEDDREAVTQAWRAMAAEGKELEMSFRIRRGGEGHDVRVVRTRTRPVRDDAGAVSGFVGILEDITDRRADEERLRASEQFLDRTGQVARIGGWEVDLRTRKARWSAQTRRICEVPEDYDPPFLGGNHFYPPQAWNELSAALDAAIQDGRKWDLELPFVTARGRHLWVRVFGEAEVEDGVAIRLVGVLQDITEQHRQRTVFLEEQALRRASEQHAAELDRLLRERSEMLDVLAHEVRQPLNNASAALQGAVSVVDEMHEQVAASRLTRAQVVLGQVMASIDNTLAVASLLARPELVQLVDADIDTLLQVTAAEMLPGDRSRIHIERDTSARTAAMDMNLMRLALRNLLSNALRCSPAGSPVTVRISDSDDPLGLLIDVENDGGPISAGLLARLFERGTLRPPGDMSPSQGLGLGLYIVRRVMDLHSGTAELLRNGKGRVAFRLFLGAGDE